MRKINRGGRLFVDRSHKAHRLGDVQVYAENIDRFLPKNTEQFALGVVFHNLFQLFLAQTRGGRQGGDLNAGRFRRDVVVRVLGLGNYSPRRSAGR